MIYGNLMGQRTRRFAGVAVVLMAGLFGLSGCGGSGDFGTVTGTVTQGDKPMVGAWVEFKPEKGRLAYSQTDDQGKYELTYGPDQKGTLTGKNTVTIGTGGNETPDGRETTKRVVVHTETVTVESGSNTFDFKVPVKVGRN